MIDKKTVEQARNTDIVAFFEKHSGFTFIHRGDVYRCSQHPSLAVKDDRLSWYWHSKGIGGFGALDYLIKVENMPFCEALKTVMGSMTSLAIPKQEMEQSKTLILPEKAGTPLRLYNYLCRKRGIDSGVVNKLIQEKKIYEDKRGNVVFVGFDEYGKARFASLRGTFGDCSFRMDCAGSDKRYGFNMACSASERLYVFESPIDAMSHASLCIADTGDRNAWRRHSRLSLAGTSDVAMLFFLNKHPSVKDLVLCLDNDSAGREAADIMVQKYAKKGLQTRIELPAGKDFNEDLQVRIKGARAVKRTNSPHNGIDI